MVPRRYVLRSAHLSRTYANTGTGPLPLLRALPRRPTLPYMSTRTSRLVSKRHTTFARPAFCLRLSIRYHNVASVCWAGWQLHLVLCVIGVCARAAKLSAGCFRHLLACVVGVGLVGACLAENESVETWSAFGHEWVHG